MSVFVRFEFVDGTAEVVTLDSQRHQELLAAGHEPAGVVPVPDGISDILQEYLEQRLGQASPGPYPANRQRDNLVSLLSVPGATVGVQRVSASTYHLFHNHPSGRRVRFTLGRVTPSAGGDIHHLRNVDALSTVAQAGTVVSVDDTDPGIVYSGTGWTQGGLSTPQAGAFGGSYHRTTTAGDAAEWQTPAAMGVGVIIGRLTNTGFAAVSIDGDETAANLLPTAQELVDAGTMDAALLTTNGGTFNPAARILDSYGFTQWGHVVQMADGLANTAHTVRVTNTGHKQAASADIRLYFDGYTWTEGGGTQEVTDLLAPAGGVWEYAFQIAAGGVTEWVGNAHGRDTQTALELTLDGQPLALADGEQVTGHELVVSRQSALTHTKVPDLGAVDLEYRLRPGTLTLTFASTFNVDLAGAKLEYPMLALSSASGGFDKGRTLAMSQDVALDAHDGTHHGDGTGSDTALMWQTAGRWAAMVNVPNPVATFGTDAMSVYLQDRLGDTMAKAYFEHRNVSLAAGEVRRSQAVYQIADLGSPDLALSL